MTDAHRFTAELSWDGSTGLGYDEYDRTHRVATGGAVALQATADPHFGGRADLHNPEQLLLAAVASCQMLSFLAIASRARLDVVAYTDEAVAVMPTDVKPMRVTEVRLRPHITAKTGSEEKLLRFVGLAHKECFIANSVSCDFRIEPTIVHVD